MGATIKPKLMQRGHADDFQTPADALAPLLPYLREEWCIWEPACGKGNLAYALADRGHTVIASDVLPALPPRRAMICAGERDFLSWDPRGWSADFHAVVTNPPYTLKTEFIERAYALERPFALLLPLTSLEGRRRQALFRRRGVEVILLPARVKFTTPSGKIGGAWFATAWFTHGLGIGQALTFWEPPQPRAGRQLELAMKGGWE